MPSQASVQACLKAENTIFSSSNCISIWGRNDGKVWKQKSKVSDWGLLLDPIGQHVQGVQMCSCNEINQKSLFRHAWRKITVQSSQDFFPFIFNELDSIINERFQGKDELQFYLHASCYDCYIEILKDPVTVFLQLFVAWQSVIASYFQEKCEPQQFLESTWFLTDS